MDVVRGLVSVDSARQDYGVVLHAVADKTRGFEVDEDATRTLRAQLRAARPPLKMINRGEYAESLIRAGRITVSDFDYPAAF